MKSYIKFFQKCSFYNMSALWETSSTEGTLAVPGCWPRSFLENVFGRPRSNPVLDGYKFFLFLQCQDFGYCRYQRCISDYILVVPPQTPVKNNMVKAHIFIFVKFISIIPLVILALDSLTLVFLNLTVMLKQHLLSLMCRRKFTQSNFVKIRNKS